MQIKLTSGQGFDQIDKALFNPHTEEPLEFTIELINRQRKRFFLKRGDTKKKVFVSTKGFHWINELFSCHLQGEIVDSELLAIKGVSFNMDWTPEKQDGTLTCRI